MRYDVFLLDFDHTLFDSDRCEVLAFDAALRAAGVDDPSTVYPLYQQINGALWAQLERGEVTPDEIRTLRFARLASTANLHVDPDRLSSDFLDGMAAFGELFPGVREVLDDLASRATLGLITNGLGGVIRPRLTRLGITEHFHAVTVSEEVGSSKPAPGIFDAAFAELGDPDPARVLMVGDSLTSDIRGGHDYGLATCWYNPSGRAIPAEHAHRVTHQIASLAELDDIAS